MVCLLCRLVCGPKKMAAMERWLLAAAWWKPNNEWEFFGSDRNQDAMRAAQKLRLSDPKRSLEDFLHLAEKGSVYSMFRVGHLFLEGLGTPVSKADGEKWLLKSSELGLEVATFTLANEYLNQKRYKDAQNLLEHPAEENRSPALFLLGRLFLFRKDKIKARTMLEKAAALGHRRAKWFLAKSCVFGKFGLRAIPLGFKLVGELGEDFENSEKDKSAASATTQARAVKSSVVVAPQG